MGIILHGEDVQSCTDLDSILSKAGLDFDVELAPVTCEGTVIPGRAAVVRSDSREVYGLVTDSYNPKNARESFAVVEELLGSGRAKALSAGALRGGKEAFVQLQLDRSVKIGGDGGETVDNYLFMHTGFDGHHALSGVLGPVRLSCTNMLPMARGASQAQIRYSHTESLDDRLKAVDETLMIVDKAIDEFEETANGLLVAKFTTPQMRSFLARLIPIPKDANPDKDRAAKNKQEARDAIMAIFANGENLANVRETKWAAYNAVAEYFDHTVAQRVRVTADTGEEQAELQKAENRFMRVLEDTKLKDKAFALLAN